MAAQERRSKRRSASSGAPPDARELGRIVFFVDRSLGNKYVPDALRAAGARVEVHESHFPSETEDGTARDQYAAPLCFCIEQLGPLAARTLAMLVRT
jgi:hypothetical protein